MLQVLRFLASTTYTINSDFTDLTNYFYLFSFCSSLNRQSYDFLRFPCFVLCAPSVNLSFVFEISCNVRDESM
jgi:hypothetical protein